MHMIYEQYSVQETTQSIYLSFSQFCQQLVLSLTQYLNVDESKKKLQF